MPWQSRADEGRLRPAICLRGAGERALLSEGVRMGEHSPGLCLGYHHLNVYRVVGGTRGSETSQYPQEKIFRE